MRPGPGLKPTDNQHIETGRKSVDMRKLIARPAAAKAAQS